MNYIYFIQNEKISLSKFSAKSKRTDSLYFLFGQTCLINIHIYIYKLLNNIVFI